MRNVIWITWERQRRTIELSRALHVRLYILESKRAAVIRYFHLTTKTILLLYRKKPNCLIVQNPSILLSFVASVLKPLFKYTLIIDRHTNFRLNLKSYTLKDMLHIQLGNISLRKADLTIVTNPYLKEYVESKGGKGFVLPDKLPQVHKRIKMRNSKDITKSIAYICTYAKDEPYIEVIRSGLFIDPNIVIYITGNFRSVSPKLVRDAPENVKFTGFIPENEYWELLNNCDIIMDFTKLEHCLVCGAYEAVALGKPLITSKTKELIKYFNKGVVHTEHTQLSISEAIYEIYSKYEIYLKEIRVLREEIEATWWPIFYKLRRLIESKSNSIIDHHDSSE